MEGRLVGGLGNVDGGRSDGIRPASGTKGVDGVVVGTVCVGVGGWAGGVGGGCPLRSIAAAAAACARVMRDGRAGQASSPFHMGEATGMTAGVSPLYGALAAQGCVFPMTSTQRVQRRLFRPSRTSAKTAAWAAVEHSRTGREVRWNRLTCVTHEPHVVNEMGL